VGGGRCEVGVFFLWKYREDDGLREAIGLFSDTWRCCEKDVPLLIKGAGRCRGQAAPLSGPRNLDISDKYSVQSVSKLTANMNMSLMVEQVFHGCRAVEH
jgi:hypothetical protein